MKEEEIKKNIKNADKIYEAYKGELGPDMQEKTKNRFSWMSKQINGNSILDVGCSSGIYSILLAREGKKVTGIDLDKDAITKAKAFLKDESGDVQENVDFIVSSLNNFEPKDAYDTIILGEVVEHLYYPEKIYSKIIKYLNPNGKVIITVPFGLNNYFDHKKIYYLLDVIKETASTFTIKKIDYLYDWVGVVCISRGKNNKQFNEIPYEYIEKLEEAFLNREKKFHKLYFDALDKLKMQKEEIKEILEKNENTIKLKDEIIKSKEKTIEDTIKKVSENYEKSTLGVIGNLSNEIKKVTKENEEKRAMLKKEQEKNIVLENDNQSLKKLNSDLEVMLKKINQRKVIVMIRKIKNVLRRIKRMLKRIKDGLFKNRLVSFFRRNKAKVKKEERINTYFYENLKNYTEQIPNSNGSNYYDKIDLKVAIITDEYMYNYYKDSVDLVYLEYNNYKEIVDSVDLVMFVSCWKGMRNNDWRGVSGPEGQAKVIEVFNYAKTKNKKTIFQTIEDPSNYDRYLPIAKEADFIFTTASEMIENYKKDTGNNNAFHLDYGINPLFHNPVGFKKLDEFRNSVFFAGSWAPRYQERCDDSEMLFDGTIASQHNLILADRNYYIKGYEFPNKYYKYIIPAIDHDILQKTHKLFDWALNLNSIKYSPTMCAMRVYELQAIGNLMISNYSMAVNNVFPNIFIANSSNEIPKILSSYSEIEIYNMQVQGIRNVMSNHTVFDKWNYILNCIGMDELIVSDKGVLVVADKITDSIKKKFDSQIIANKKLVELNNISSKELKKYNYIAYFSESTNYLETYLQDMINAFKYTNSDFVSIESSINNDRVVGISHDFISNSKNIDKVVLDSNKYDIKKIIKAGEIEGNGYCIDPFSISELKVNITFDPKISVVVPIYNNGKFLLYKCFNSLLRSSVFNNMEIILVDDGSTDLETIKIIRNIEKKYKNVKTYFFNDGGSGSASRPRNKGVELATTEYITYLDPDNEAINDGYAVLYNKILEDNYDFVFGNIIKLSDRVSTFSYDGEEKEFNDPKRELINKNFKTNSIQACLIKKKLIIDNKIENPIGAAGQDSLFFQELMIVAKKVYYVNLPIHVYYASRENSIVNSINSKFFEKFLIMEKYQVKKLKTYGLLDEYKQRRYEDFLNNWYLEKLKIIKNKKEHEKSLKIINKIKALYGVDNEK